MSDKYRAPENYFTKKGDLHHMADNDPFIPADAEEGKEDPHDANLPQSISLDPGKLIDQLMRRYGAQLQQQTWDNAQLATENDALRTLLAEGANDQQAMESTIAEMAQREDFLLGKLDEGARRELQLERLTDELRSAGKLNGMTAEVVIPADDPPEVDAFLAMASGQPGLASGPAPEETSATTQQP